jgi:hypothetical protein
VISSACITAMGDFIDIADFPEQLQHRGEGRQQGRLAAPVLGGSRKAAYSERAGGVQRESAAGGVSLRNWANEFVSVFERGWIRPEPFAREGGRRVGSGGFFAGAARATPKPKRDALLRLPAQAGSE